MQLLLGEVQLLSVFSLAVYVKVLQQPTGDLWSLDFLFLPGSRHISQILMSTV